MKNKDVVIAFLQREKANSSTYNLRSTGNCLYSYFTCIAEFNKDGNLYINLTKYSLTTSRHQTLLNKYLEKNNFKFIYNIEYNVERNKTHIVPKNERIYM